MKIKKKMFIIFFFSNCLCVFLLLLFFCCCFIIIIIIIIIFFFLLGGGGGGGKYLQCSLNILTLQFCRCDISTLPTPVLNLATFMYKHLLGHNVYKHKF